MNELILIVDDEPSIIELSRMYLEREGFRTQSARDGASGLEMVAREHPAVSYTHLTLPTNREV